MVVAMMVGLLAWAISLWQSGTATTGDVVLTCTLGFSILQATRELAYAFVDVTQHMARLAEAVGTLLLPHEIRDHPSAAPISPGAGRVLIDGQDIARVSQESLRERIGVVPQDISLFHRSIMDNIRYGRPEAADE